MLLPLSAIVSGPPKPSTARLLWSIIPQSIKWVAGFAVIFLVILASFKEPAWPLLGFIGLSYIGLVAHMAVEHALTSSPVPPTERRRTRFRGIGLCLYGVLIMVVCVALSILMSGTETIVIFGGGILVGFVVVVRGFAQILTGWKYE
ncbi:MAG: hypothetical protein K8U57_12770 [Planctomycetes bacterium]|nr:hypothetical protein [Planctomycetota bacterium]